MENRAMEKLPIPALRYQHEKLQSIDAAIEALDIVERDAEKAQTYAEIKKQERIAEAYKALYQDFSDVRQKAERVILVAKWRIKGEIAKIPKASGGDRKSKIATSRNLKSG